MPSAHRTLDVTKCRLSLLLCAALSLAPATALALDPTVPITQHLVDFWQENAGLPQHFVMSLLQTRDGYLWVGTKGGLARFDGVRFSVYDDRQPGQLREPEIWALAETDDASLWIATLGGGLTRLKDGAFTTYTTKDGLPSDVITALSPGPGGSLWIGTDVGLVHLEAGRFTTYKLADGLPDDRIVRLFTDKEGILWIGTAEGLGSFWGGRFVNHSVALPGQLQGSIATIAGDMRGGLWIGLWRANRGLGVRRLKDGVLTRFTTREGLPSDDVKSIVVDPGGTVWIGTLEGVCQYRSGRFERYFSEFIGLSARGVPATVSLRGIQVLSVDREGSLWIGTRSDGLARLRDGVFLNVTGTKSEASSLDVRSVFEDGRGTLWLGTPDGVRRLGNRSSTAFALPGGLSADTLAEDGSGTLWIGTGAGLFHLVAGRIERVSQSELRDTGIFALFRDGHGALWVGTSASGLFRRAGNRWTHYGPEQGLLGDQVRAVAQDARGRLWIATRNGGVSCLGGDRFTTFGTEQGLASPAAQAIFVDREDVVWVATRRGLSRIRDGRVGTITAQNGLPANYFYQIIEDDLGYLWLTFGRGIARVSRAELNAVADGKATLVNPTLFGTEHGLRTTAMPTAHQPSAWKSRDGRLWFATGRGAAVIDPRSMGRNAVPPPVRIEELHVDQRPWSPSTAVVCPPGHGNVEIRYTGLSYVAPERVRFRYLLEGFDRGWQDAGTRRAAYYTNLPPGDYRFRVAAFNNDGVRSAEEAALAFHLLPHWYQTRWWSAFATLVVLGMVAGVARFAATRRLRREVRQLERQQAVERERARIAEDIHDDLGAGLTRIALLSELAQREPAPEARDHLGRISDTARELTRTMDEIVWAINSRNDTLDGLVSYVCKFAQGYLTLTGIRCRLDVPTELPSLPLASEVRHNLFLAIKEALHNVVKHAHATETWLRLALQSGTLSIVIEDNGLGIASDASGPEADGGRIVAGQGLPNLSRRLLTVGGTCVVHGVPGIGTRVMLTVPLPSGRPCPQNE